ncbi:MAG: DUF262 domain-containing HNH endonuclease family protein [Synergistaceae bacterium]|nr:DUF262 domain-containing HNH endonuclease family protein [Synergistaceae bacterium]
MSGQINELKILDKRDNIFSDKTAQYIIPLYQRAFAWEDKELSQLIEDINDFKEDNYYIGSLIVSKKEGENLYEVIDGQQRLTALFLLLNSLDVQVENTLTFECRKRSDDTLKNIKKLEFLKNEDIEISLQNGKQIVDTLINGRDFNKRHFLSQLRKVKLYRIEVPQNTDLNRYFEIMNTRGEQLEQHDILKASLMSAIKSDENKMVFAKIWNACSDMTGYVQMHFDTATRRELFDYDWKFMPQISFATKKTNKKNAGGLKIQSIISPSFKVDESDGITDKDERIRFESIISFPFFLLHTLKVLVADMNIQHFSQGETLVYDLLDDKKLADAFKRVISKGVIKGKKIADMEEQFSLSFIKCLLKCRFLFDKYIIKREFANENSDGEWSLKQLEVSGQASNKKAYYINTNFGQSGEWERTWKPRTDLIIMLQSCLRVSYTSPKIMHWITESLKWLYSDDGENLQRLSEYEWVTESIVATAVKSDYLDIVQNGAYDWGIDTPHIVFNYLDYLLWKSDRKKYDSFTFEFRNSVEHWYPQHPSEGTFEQWTREDGVDGFGNLCLIQRRINSKFSNMSPEAKKSTFSETIAKGSLKLRIMSGITVACSNKNASQNWKDNVCEEHENEMIEALIDACNSFN